MKLELCIGEERRNRSLLACWHIVEVGDLEDLLALGPRLGRSLQSW